MRRPGTDHITKRFDEAGADVTIRPARKRETKPPAPYSIRFDEDEKYGGSNLVEYTLNLQ